MYAYLLCHNCQKAYFCRKVHPHMTNHPLWRDEYWLLLLQIFLQRPVGIKAMYSKKMVALALELHIPPEALYAQMFCLRGRETPTLEKLWTAYAGRARRLAVETRRIRRMSGFGMAAEFYRGVDVTAESWEKDFKPIAPGCALTPTHIILIMDLYFRLIPATMVPETPEIMRLAKLMRIREREVCRVMEALQQCDPCLVRRTPVAGPYTEACQRVWQRFGNDRPERLAALAAQMKEWFK